LATTILLLNIEGVLAAAFAYPFLVEEDRIRRQDFSSE
jgi:hypothetical protein